MNEDINNLIWHGRVVSREEWEANRPNVPFESASDVKGRGYRVAVRIYSKHPRSRTTLPDSDLELIEVLGSTSGSGVGGNGDTPGITQGDEVFGLYRDGNGGDPIIIGTRLPNANTQFKLYQNDDGFSAFSGFKFGENIPNFLIPNNNSFLLENTRVTNPNQVSISDVKKISEESITLQSPCDGTNLNLIQSEIQKLIQKIEKVKRQNKSWINSILSPIRYNNQNLSVDEYISVLISNTSKTISKFFKNVTNDIRQYIIELISTKAKLFYSKLFPKEKTLVIKSVNSVLDTVFCIFNRITSNLLKIVSKILGEVVNKYVNVPLCAVENIISTVLANIFSYITSLVTNAIQPIKNILGSVSLLVEDFLNASQTILKLFSCEENSKCPTVKSWNPITGANQTKTIDFDNIVKRTKEIQSNLKFTPDLDNLNLDLSSLYNDTCNVGPLFCGPPTIEFIGGGGSGASANAIINAIGEIISVDLIDSGSNYTTAPIVKFVDSCGLGSGATAMSEINSSGQVSNVIITTPGKNYLSTYDGSLGGDGRKWMNPNEKAILNPETGYQQPVNPSEPLLLKENDVEIGPFNSNNITFNQNYAFDKTGKYPVYLKLCNFRILNSGFNYSNSDQIMIEPQNNAEMIPRFNEYGALIDIEIKSSGFGFESIPTIYIKTETGRNAQILPILCASSIKNTPNNEIQNNMTILSVVDCVGKI